MAQVLLVSKPIAPPWNDSSKNLVRDLASGLGRHTPRVLGRRGAELELGRAIVEPFYPPAAAREFAPALWQNARVAARLLAGPRADIWHFFFAPNRRSSAVGRLAARLRGVPTVQTICSAPAAGAPVADLLFADRNVVLSRQTERRLLEAGVAPARVRRIPPAVPPLVPLDAPALRAARRGFELPEAAPVVVFPGDLEFGAAAGLVLEALPRLARDTVLVLACRAKTERARERERALRDRARALDVEGRVRWVGETPDILALLGAADLVALPAGDLYAKMDYPLVILESMWLARPCLVAAGSSAAELAEAGAVQAVLPEVGPFADAARALLSDPAARTELGRRARQVAARDHTPVAMALAYEELYDALLRERR